MIATRRLGCAGTPQAFCLRPTTMTAFCKNEHCPSSNELLAYENGEVSGPRATEILQHLDICEFCELEAELYSRYPQFDLTPDVGEPSQIPGPLYELAEALLKNRQADANSLNSLLKKRKGVVLDKV